MSKIFLAKAVQDDVRGNYLIMWKEKIKDTFSNSNIVDLIEVEKQIVKDDNGMPFYGVEWRGWKVLYQYEKKYFFPIIDDCDFLIAAESWSHPRRGKYTARVIIEMEYALEIGKKVFGISISDWEIKKITKEDLIKIRQEKEDEIVFLDFLRRNL
jgi:hypothetical protein